MADACLLTSDHTFGPRVDRRCRDFDFTLLFEDVVFGVIPAALLILILPLQIFYLTNCTVKHRSKKLVICKILTLLSLLVFQIAFSIVRNADKSLQTGASIPSGGFNAIATLGSMVNSVLENQRTIRPSYLLVVYFSLSALLTVPLSRTIWLMNTSMPCKVVSVVVSLATFSTALLEMVEKKKFLGPTYEHLPREQFQGIWGNAFFIHTLSLFRRGFSVTLQLGNIPKVDEDLQGAKSGSKIGKSWNLFEGRHRLLKATFRAFRWPLLSAVLPRLVLTGFLFTQPFLIAATIQFVQTPYDLRPPYHASALIGAYFLSQVGLALSTSLYWRQTYRSITMIRAGLISTIYTHTIISHTQEVNGAAAITVMGTDVERIVVSLRNMHEVWASLLQAAIAIWLLARQVGLACFVPLIIAAISVAATATISRPSATAQKAWIERVQARLAATSSMLHGMKSICMLGLEDVLLKMVSNLRKLELRTSERFRKLLIWQIALSNVPEDFAPFATLTVYAVVALKTDDGSILAQQAFSSLALISLLTSPLLTLCQALPALLQAEACFERIEVYCKGFTYVDTLTKADLELQSTPMIPITDFALFNFKDVAISRSEQGIDILKNLNVTIQPGITVVTGRVGCGKSTFLEACLGKHHVRNGSLTRRYRNGAYCPQTPWMQHCDILQSIVGPLEFDLEWYKFCIWASGLEPDLVSNDEHSTKISIKNAKSSSGGQRLRIALARAIYSRLEVTLLDDIFSGVDESSVTTITQRLFGNDGYFRTAQRSVIIATTCKQVWQLADTIIVLDNGRVVEQGSFTDAKQRIRGFLQNPVYDENHGTATCKTLANCYPTSPEDLNGVETSADDHEARTNSDRWRRYGSLSVYSYYFRSAGYPLLLLFAIFTAAECFCSSFLLIWLQWWVEANEQRPNQRLGMYIGVYGLLTFSSMIAMIIGCWVLFMKILNRSSLNLHSALLKSVLCAPIAHLQSLHLGHIVNRFSQDLELVDMQLPVHMVQFVSIAFLCFIRLIILCAIGKYLAASVPFFLFVVYLLQRLYLRTSRQVRLLDIEAKAPLYSHFLESIQGIHSINAFGWEEAFSLQCCRFLDDSQGPFYMLFCIQQWLKLVLDLLVGAMTVILVTVVVKVNGFSPAEVGVALNLLLMLNENLAHAIKMWTMMETSIGAISRIQHFVEQTPRKTRDCANLTRSSEEYPLGGSIELKTISAGYSSPTLTLNGVSASFPPGSRTLICGSSGCGKTTFISTLFDIIPLTDGKITIGGHDIAAIPRLTLQNTINIIPQEPFFLDGTYRFNIDPKQQKSDTEIWGALARLHIKDKIIKLNGLDEIVDAGKWSAGEKQLLSLARAIMKGGTILVLDEAMSSVDEETATLMQSIIEREFSRHTVLTISHQARFLDWYHRVIFMDHGQIVKQGGIELLKCMR